MAGGEAELGGFLEAAGRSLGEAQKELAEAGGGGVPTTIAISEVELEVKATLEQTASGPLGLRPVTSGEAQRDGVSPEALSTLKVRYVAIADEEAGAAPTKGAARRTEGAVIAEVRGRADIASLERTLGDLEFRATFVPSARRWLVSVSDNQNHAVREVVVPDSPD